MNPFSEHRKSYMAACFLIAAMYAFTLGRSLPVSFRLTDIAIYGGLLCLSGFILWNTFKFATPPCYMLKFRLMFMLLFAVLTSLLITGTESFTLYLLYPSLFDSFIYSIPARLFITLLLFTIIRLFYIVYYEKGKIPGKNPDTIEKQTVPDETANTFQAPDISGKIIQDAVTHTEYRLNPENNTTSPTDRITVRSGQKIKIIPIKDIIYIKADGDYISINTSEGNWLKEQTMKYTEDILPFDQFVRIHRSYIVNINHISRIERYGDRQQVVLHTNEKIKISTARYQTLRQILGF